jgi:hypothetical protein
MIVFNNLMYRVRSANLHAFNHMTVDLHVILKSYELELNN